MATEKIEASRPKLPPAIRPGPLSRDSSSPLVDRPETFTPNMPASVKFHADCEIGVEELFEMMERSASNAVYPTLKRVDEKHVTEAAYDNPKFVEDIVRDMAQTLKADARIAWFRCGSENFESIHQHNAFAQIEWLAISRL